jgi:hypothetical protein
MSMRSMLDLKGLRYEQKQAFVLVVVKLRVQEE